MTDASKTVDLVLEGGGVKGTSLLGAVLALYDAGYTFARIAGTSAGAIVGALVASYQKAGRDLHELEDIMNGLQYHEFAEGSLLERIPVLGDGINVLLHEGAHDGNYLKEWLGPILEGVGVKTFADLRQDDADSSLPQDKRYSLVVHASDLSRGTLVRMPWDYDQYGLKGDEQLVVDAVRASMSVPGYFRPVTVASNSGSVTWVDGGLLSNFPITAFDRTDGKPERWPTWGIKLSSKPDTEHDEPITSAARLLIRLLGTLTSEWNRYALDDEGVNRRTVFVDTMGISSLDFGISDENKKKLFASGQTAARKFLELQKPNR
ncbi:patatin-like phospholipase family protein [Streptomyces sp. TS71-3]|uniref:patatin-like phospholipase family protein n=1 Tax=Streptomyces sp. TS71-3 TaxID=2733862 RepID=UPI001B18363E|nr:patatin-like phospholipase family protein [Streptomyces sp. TS71-3]GHJ37032.1 membrane protein [Streptomyces sp. TS71-3]